MTSTKNRPADRIIDVEIRRLPHTLSNVPTYATAGSAGLDLMSARPGAVRIEPGEVEKIPTGISIHIGEPGIAAFVFPRSGRATKEGLVLANTVGVIDSDYQGEIICMVRNQHPTRTLFINEGERIAQIVFMPVYAANLIPVESFETETTRGEGGFGSTGIGGGRPNIPNERDHLIAAASALEL